MEEIECQHLRFSIVYNNNEKEGAWCLDCESEIEVVRRRYNCNECGTEGDQNEIILPSNGEWICRCFICDYVIREIPNLDKERRVKVASIARHIDNIKELYEINEN